MSSSQEITISVRVTITRKGSCPFEGDGMEVRSGYGVVVVLTG